MIARSESINPGSLSHRTIAIPLLCAAFALAVACFTPAVLNDGDTYWHIAAGAWMLDHRAVLTVDPFSYTFAGRPWQTHEWLAEILLALAYRATGWSGVVLLCALGFAATAGLLARYLGRFLSGPAQGVVTLLALSCVSGSLLARPHLLALPILTFWTIALLRARDEERAPPLALAALIAVWANLHASYLFGLALIAPIAIEAFFEARENRAAAFRSWAVFGAIAGVMSLATPFGIEAILFPFRLMAMPSLAFIGEWQPADLTKLQPLEVCIAALAYVWITRRLRVSAVRVALLAVLLYLAVAHARHNMIAGIVGALVIAKPLGAALGSQDSPSRVSFAPMPVILVVLAVIFGLRLSIPIVRSDGAVSPISALQHVPPDLKRASVLNDYAFGGYLIFADLKPYIDSRAELYGEAFLQNYARMTLADRSALTQTLAAHDVAWTIFAPANPVVGVLDRLPGWRRLYADQWSVVHVRGETARMIGAR